MPTSHLHLRVLRSLLALAILLSLIAGIVQILPFTPIVTAQIDNNQPIQPFASAVDCIRVARDVNGNLDTHDLPRFAVSCFGSAWDLTSYSPAGNPANGDALASDSAVIEFGDATPDGSNDLAGLPVNGHATLSTLGEMGSVFGLAYATGTNTAAPTLARAQRLFIGAFSKRLTRFGTGGPGAIYVVNRSGGGNSLYVTVPDVVPGPNGAAFDAGDGSAGTFPNGAAYSVTMGGIHATQHDAISRAYVSKTSLGDIEIDPQERYLYAVNLRNRLVYRFDTWDANPQGTMTTLSLPPIFSNPQWCNISGAGGPQDARPFGMQVTASNLYLGYVCSAETSQDRRDLTMGVLRYDLAAGTWNTAMGTALSVYDGQRTFYGGDPAKETDWQPWRTLPELAADNNAYIQQPLLTDLDVAEDGSMLLGLHPRNTDIRTSGRVPEAYSLGMGDLLRALPSGAGTWAAPDSATEYFADTGFINGVATHPETGWGGLTYVPGRHNGQYGGEVLTTMIAPYRGNTGGLAWYDVMQGGTATANEEIYGQSAETFGKAAGLGDVELLCAWRAIGDRIWRDTNSNGVQDAGEPDISGVRVQLLNSNGTVVATVTTGAVSSMPGNYRFYVNPFATYTVRIDPAMFNPGQPLNGLAPTAQNAGDDNFDSDADAGGTIAIASAGNRNVTITYDIGLVSGANVRIAKSGPATALPTQTVTYQLAYANDGPAPAQNVTVVDTLPAGLTYASANPAPSSVSGQTITWNLGTLSSGASGTISVQATVSSGASGALVNQSQISTTTTGDVPGDNTSTTTTTVVRPGVSIQKSAPAAVTVGNGLAYTLTYRNTGNADAGGVSVVDTLPAGVSFVSASPNPSSVAGQTLTWNLGTVTAGAAGTITVNVQTSAALANGTTLTNQATITTTTPGDDPSDNTSTTITTAQRADVYVTKSSPTSFPVVSAQPVTYYLDYGNRGPAAATNVQLVDTVPTQLSGVSWTCESGCAASGSGNAISINLGTLPAGATGRVRVTGTATTSLAREDFTNTATVSTSTPETDTTNNTSSVPGAVWTTDVQIIKLADAQATAGTNFAATLTYRNNGPAPAQGVILVDTLPAGVSFVSASPAPSTVAGMTLTWNLGTLADAQTGTINLVLRADAAINDGARVRNNAAISTTTTDRTPANNTSTADTQIIARADLEITKTGPARVTAGGDVAFTLAYQNIGPSVARGAIIEDTLPADLDFVSATPAPTSNAGGVLTWNVGDLNGGANGTISVLMRSRFAQDAATLTATNNVRITSTTTDQVPGNNTSTHSVAVETVDLSILKDMPTFVVAGVPFTATLTYANAGPADATSVTLRDLAPTGLTFVSASPAPTGPGLRWNLGTLAAGGTGVINVRFLAASSVVSGTQYLNQAIIDTTSPDRDPSNDAAQARTTVRPNADLSVVKTGTPGPILSGSPVTYTLAYENAGPSVALGVTVTDTPPEGFVFSSATPAPDAGGALRWTLGDLAVGASGVITVRGTLTGDAATTTRTNTATITSAGTPDPVPANNTSTSTTTVLQPDLAISKTDNRTTAQPGDVLTYTLTITNSGPITATDVLLTETPPLPITDVAWTAAGAGSYTQTIAQIAPGASVTRTMTLTLPNPLPAALQQTIRNVTTVRTACCTDPTPADTTSTDTTLPLTGEVGDLIWLDTNGNGVQDTGEAGLANVPLDLIDPITGVVLATTTTDANGGYRFSGLRLGDYAVRINPQAMSSTYSGYAITTAPIPVTALTPGTVRDDTLDIGLRPSPTTAVAMTYTQVETMMPRGYIVRWGTLTEQDTDHFRVERTLGRDHRNPVAIGLLPSLGSRGGDYRLTDAAPPVSGPIYYWIIEVEADGDEAIYGPLLAPATTQTTGRHIYAPLVLR